MVTIDYFFRGIWRENLKSLLIEEIKYTEFCNLQISL